MKRTRKKRLLSLLLAVSLLLQNGGITGYAAAKTTLPSENSAEAYVGEKETEETLEPEEKELREELPAPEILSEVEENRGTHSKEYLLSDQSHAVYLYQEPVHYKNEEGQLLEIDNTLVETKEGYENAENSYEVLITDNEESRGQVIYQEEDYMISWQMVEQLPEVLVEEVSTEEAPREEASVTEVSGNFLVKEEEPGEEPTEESQGEEAEEKSERLSEELPQSSVSENSGQLPETVSDNELPFETEELITTQEEEVVPLVFEKQKSGKEIGKKEGIAKEPEILIYGTTPPSLLEAEVTKEQTPGKEAGEEITGELPPAPSSSVITFSGYDKGVRVEYSPTGDGIKENIILPSPDCPGEYTFQLKTKGLSARINEAGEVEFYDQQTDEVEYYFPAPFLVDAKGNLSYDAWYELRQGGEEAVTLTEDLLQEESLSGNSPAGNPSTALTADSISGNNNNGNNNNRDNSRTGESISENSLPMETLLTVMEEEKKEGICYLTICLGEEWRKQAAYPVVVDPVLKQNRGKNLKDSGSICSNNTVTETLYVGKNSTGIYRSFVRFDLPKLPAQSIVSEAQLYLNGTRTEGDTHYLTVSMVTEPWYHKGEEKEGKELSWSQQPKAAKVLDYHVNGGNFNITKAVRQWFGGEQENYGLVFQAYNEEKAKRATLHLKNHKTSPYLKITYRTDTGLEDYYGYHTTGAGTAGAGYVHDYTGALTVVNSAVTTPGNRFPMAITRVYNSNDTKEKGGWRFNYEQTLKIPTDQVDITTYPYVFTDEDGTTHYFKKGDVTYLQNGESKTAKGSATLPSAKDEDGLQLFVVPVTDTALKETYPLKLIDKSSSLVRYFDKMGRLAMITDSNQYENGKNSDSKEKNALTITYESYEKGAGLEAFDQVISSATALKQLCSSKTTTTEGEDYQKLLAQLEEDMEALKKDLYATSDYKTAKQVHTAATRLADLTDPVSTVARSTALDRATALISAIEKAKTQAEPLVEESRKRITSVTDAVGNRAVFTYDEKGRVAAISDPTYENPKETSYTYDEEGNLTGITFADGRKAWYTYGKDHLLLSAQDKDGYKVSYTYRESDKRMIKVEECHGPTPDNPTLSFTPGQTYGISYGTDNTTTFCFSGVDDVYGTGDDIENVHVFDEQG
ncbi:MAG: DNRLRE domain-containing protein, partial [Lachnospiraceae bacterium]|nr:DNRLRE domain-containing protein [Lachnospiraceae bacterium]